MYKCQIILCSNGTSLSTCKQRNDKKKNVKCWVQGPCQTAILRKIRCRWARMANMYKMTLASSSS